MNCETFHDELLQLFSGKLGPKDRAMMLEHASGCPDCEAVLGVEETLQVWRDEGVTSNVPHAMVTSMWPAVRTEMAGDVRRSPAPRPSRGWTRIAGTAIAALLLVGAGYLIGTLGVDTPEPPGAGSVPGGGTPAEFASPAALASADILTELAGLPDEMTLITSEEARMLLRRSAQIRRWAAAVASIVDPSDGVQVGEVRILLSTLPADGGTALPAALSPEELRRWLKRRV